MNGHRTQAPNILLLMADQMAAPALPIYGHRVVKAPNMSALAAQGVVFENAYCNFPICAPSRYSILSGRLPTSIDAFDNASEFCASVPTLAHYLCALGYSTILCGKMHFVGPDQLHGYEERLTTDVYPASFTWTPNWLAGPANAPTGISVRVVKESGHCIRSLQMDYDDEVEFFAIQKLYDLARIPERKPFFLTVSFSQPHSPYTAPIDHWNLYEHQAIDLPAVPPIPLEQLDTYSRWLFYSHGRDRYKVAEEDVRNARHAYYGMITYIDDKVGRILRALERTGFARDTVVILTSDHGEMLGERGMWFKQTFYEWSSRVPLVISYPTKFAAGREKKVVSLVDLMPTILDLVTDGAPPQTTDRLDGRSMVKLLSDGDQSWPDTAISEYTDMGVCAPCRMIRRGGFKYIYTHGHPGQLFNVAEDPTEVNDLAGQHQVADVEQSLLAGLLRDWDPEQVNERVLASQRRRQFIEKVSTQSGKYSNWAYVVRKGDELRFVRGGGAESGAAAMKRLARFPYVKPLE